MSSASESPVSTGLFYLRRSVFRRFAIALAVAMLLGCGQQPAEVSIDELARNPEMYRGHRVDTRGELNYHPSPPHYWIESAAGARVEVLGLRDPDLLPGSEVRVSGWFRYSRDRGRRIEVETQELPY